MLRYLISLDETSETGEPMHVICNELGEPIAFYHAEHGWSDFRKKKQVLMERGIELVEV